MHPHTHTGLHARIFLLQTNSNVSSIVTNIHTHTSSESLPMTYCCPLSTYMLCMAEGKYEADIVPTIKALVEKKQNKSNALLLLLHE